MPSLRLLSLIPLALAASLAAFAASPKAEEQLAELIATQKTLFAEAEKKADTLDAQTLQTDLQQLCQRYDQLLHHNADFTAAYVGYGMLLNKAGMRKEAVALFHRANLLDKNLPLVKNQIGNYLAEEGRPVEASNFFLAAIQLSPREPLYHYQLATLLTEARDDFIKSGQYTRTSLEQAAREAYRQATLLAPDDWRFAYGYGLFLHELETPDWPAALAYWQAFETRLKPGVEQQVARLHQAKILGRLARLTEARSLLASVTEPALHTQKAAVSTELETPTPPSSSSSSSSNSNSNSSE